MMGYMDSWDDSILDKISRAIDMIEYDSLSTFEGFLLLQSAAGGTGSGLGARLSEILKAEFPKKTLLNIAIWPHSRGEVIVQNYNTALTMGSILNSSDGIVVIENDMAKQVCQTKLNIKLPSFADMNALIAAHLVSVFFPICEEQSATSAQIFTSEGKHLYDIKR